MVIRSSSAREVERLLAQLRDGNPVDREAAVARLRVIGVRAVDRLAALARAAGPDAARIAAIRTLEGIDDPRARDLVLELAASAPAAVAAAAVAASRAWLESDAGVLDAVAAIALDAGGHDAVRTAAIHALAALPRGLGAPVLERLRAEHPSIAARVARDEGAATLDSPEGMREWVAVRGPTAALSELHDAIVRMREREREAAAGRRPAWQAARGAAHAALAARGSRVAVYDLRETLDGAQGPLPIDFVSATALVGDASCLEPLAKAWTAAGTDRWWRDRLADAARAIVAREKLTGRNSFVKRVRVRHPGFLG